jgi:hypothetical protein
MILRHEFFSQIRHIVLLLRKAWAGLFPRAEQFGLFHGSPFLTYYDLQMSRRF